MSTLQPLLDWTEQHQNWAAFIVFLVAMSESLVLVGYVVPGIFILFGVGALVATGSLDLWNVLIWAAAGAMAGDVLSFWLGYYYQDRLRTIWPFRNNPSWLERGEVFFQRHGGKGVVIGRFIGAVRPIVPLVAGMLRMSPLKFIIIDGLSSVAWAPVFILPGVVFGASLGLASEVGTRLGVLLVGMIVLALLLVWLAYRGYRYLQPRADRIIGGLLTWGQSRRLLGNLTIAVLDPSRPEARALMIVATMLTLFAAGLLGLGQYLGGHNPLATADRAVFTLFNGLRTPWADHIMVTLMGLGDSVVLLLLGMVVLGWLVGKRYWVTALHWLAALGFAAILSFVVGREPTPWTVASIAHQAITTLWTNGHVVQATVIYGFLAVLLSREIKLRYRWIAYALASVIISTVALARLYLGGNWLSQVLIGVILGTVWVMILGIAYRRHVSRLLVITGLPIATALALALGSMWYISVHKEVELQRYVTRPQQEYVAMEAWWSRAWSAQPALRIDLGGHPSQPLTVQWSGNIDDFRIHLEQQGWVRPVALGLVSSLQWLRIAPPLNELPLLPQAHDGRHESLVLVHATDDPQQELVLRLWSSDYRIHETRGRLWIGNVAYQRPIEPLPLLTVPLSQHDFDEPLAEFKKQLKGLKWRSVQRDIKASALGNIIWKGEVVLIRPAK